MYGDVTIKSARREGPPHSGPLAHGGEGLRQRNTGVSERKWIYVDFSGLPGQKTRIPNHLKPLKSI